MEPINDKPLFLKHPTPQDDGDDEWNTSSMHPPNDLHDTINVGPLPNLLQNEPMFSVLTRKSTYLSKNSDDDADADAGNSTIAIDYDNSNQSSTSSHFHTSVSKKYWKFMNKIKRLFKRWSPNLRIKNVLHSPNHNQDDL